MFICNHCPYVQAIAARLAADTQALVDEGTRVVAVMSNDYQLVPSDSPDNMRRFAAQNGFAFPYLVDEDQAVGRAFGAVCTPEFFGFNKVGELQYRGRLDDLRMGSAGQHNPELLNAMRQIALTGRPARVCVCATATLPRLRATWNATGMLARAAPGVRLRWFRGPRPVHPGRPQQHIAGARTGHRAVGSDPVVRQVGEAGLLDQQCAQRGTQHEGLVQALVAARQALHRSGHVLR